MAALVPSAFCRYRPAPRSLAGAIQTWARRFVIRTVFPFRGDSRSRTPAKQKYEPRIDILLHGYEYANTACWPDWLPTETQFLPQNVAVAQVQSARSSHDQNAAVVPAPTPPPHRPCHTNRAEVIIRPRGSSGCGTQERKDRAAHPFQHHVVTLIVRLDGA